MGAPENFGSGYTFAIANTVTNDDVASQEVVGEGAMEYLVFFGMLTAVAAEFGLVPDPKTPWARFRDPKGEYRDHYVEPGPAGGKHAAFRLLVPQYDERNENGREMAAITRLYAAFVFQKRGSSGSVRVASATQIGTDSHLDTRPSKRQRPDMPADQSH